MKQKNVVLLSSGVEQPVINIETGEMSKMIFPIRDLLIGKLEEDSKLLMYKSDNSKIADGNKGDIVIKSSCQNLLASFNPSTTIQEVFDILLKQNKENKINEKKYLCDNDCCEEVSRP